MSQYNKREKRHKTTFKKYFEKAVEVKGRKGQKVLKVEEDAADVKIEEGVLGEEPPNGQIRIRKLEDIMLSLNSPQLINISRTSQGLIFTRPPTQQPPKTTPTTAQTLPTAPTHSIPTTTSTSPSLPRPPPIVLGNINSIVLGSDQRLYDMLSDTDFHNHMKAQQHFKQQSKQKSVRCNCRKTHCLKMYCQCISKNLYCNSDCLCKDCHNNTIHQALRQKTKEKIGSKKAANKPQQQVRSCNCKKSHCNKKYCECFGSGEKCSRFCNCVGCHNRPVMVEQEQEEEEGQGQGEDGQGAIIRGVKEEDDKPITFNNYMRMESNNQYSNQGTFNHQFNQESRMFGIGGGRGEDDSSRPVTFTGVNKKE